MYKYRSLESPLCRKRLKEIIENEKIYASPYKKLNDPMEGVYHSAGLTIEQIETLKQEKLNCRIVSLSKTHTDGSMWVFYADECRGCCIEVEPISNYEWKHKDIKYDAKLKNIRNVIRENYLCVAEDILTQKLNRWRYEQEVRYIKELNIEESAFLPVKIKNIYLGHKIDPKYEKLVNGWVKKANKTRGLTEKIEVIKMARYQYTWNTPRTKI